MLWLLQYTASFSVALGLLGACFEPPGALLAALWPLLGRSWALLGRSWPLLAALGRSWGALGALLGPSWGILVGLGLDLGSILGQFLVDLGAIWAWLFRFSLVFFSLLSCFELRKAGESWGELGSVEENWGQLGKFG